MLKFLLANRAELHCHQLVREVVGRRSVYQATLQQADHHQAVFAKVFIGSDYAKYARRDSAGYTRLSRAGIRTPQLLADEPLHDGTAWILCYRAIEAENAEDLYAQYQLVDSVESNQKRFDLMRQLTHTVALHHNAGLIQTDLYLKNFLVKSDIVYTLDGDGIRPLVFFKKRRALKNLSTLFSKMDVLDDAWIDPLYHVYCETRGISYSLFVSAKVWVQAQKIRHDVANHYANKKVFRTCTDVTVTQNARQFLAISKGFLVDCTDQQLEAKQLDASLNSTKNNIKNGNTCTVGMAQMGAQKVVIKRYNIKNFWHGVKLALRLSRAAKSWANAHLLIISNIPTARPLALLVERKGRFRRRAYFLSEYCDAPDIAEFFEHHDLVDKEIVAKALATLFYKLYLLKISHNDTKASNIKVADFKPVLIDLDAMQSHTSGWIFQGKHVRDLKRLMRNWMDDGETTDLIRQAFISQYREEDAILRLAGFN